MGGTFVAVIFITMLSCSLVLNCQYHRRSYGEKFAEVVKDRKGQELG